MRHALIALLLASFTHAATVRFPGKPANHLIKGAGDPCVDASRIGDPVIEFMLNVGLDIKPGSTTNPVNPSAHGVIQVAVLGSDVFHVADVDESKLAFGPDGAVPVRKRTRDANRDGFVDLIVQFRTDETGIVFGDTEACVEGQLSSGRPLRGCDAIRTVPGRGVAVE
jgi:hypothetical protein